MSTEKHRTAATSCSAALNYAADHWLLKFIVLMIQDILNVHVSTNATNRVTTTDS